MNRDDTIEISKLFKDLADEIEQRRQIVAAEPGDELSKALLQRIMVEVSHAVLTVTKRYLEGYKPAPQPAPVSSEPSHSHE